MRIVPKLAAMDDYVLRRISKKVSAPARLVLWNGRAVMLAEDLPLVEVAIGDRMALLLLLLDPETNFGELYTSGRVRVEGSLEDLLTAASRAGKPSNWYRRLISSWLTWRFPDDMRGSRRNIHHHYDLGTDFFRLWLDSSLNYTCAYFPSPALTLEKAQAAKMDLVCQKLRLRPGESVLEAGCGWGALALHMARNYGVTVKAFNISKDQIAYARESARREALHQRVEFIEDDYRNIRGHSDVFLSVGMLEHVGGSRYHELSDVIHRTIGNSGRGLLHFIGRNRPRPFNNWIRRHIFPGAYAPALREVMPIFEPWNYAVVDVENLRQHYEWTLQHWLERFEQAVPQIRGTFDEAFIRAWRFYLTGSVAAFRAGTLQLFQVLFAGSECHCLPPTRADLYQTSVETHLA